MPKLGHALLESQPDRRSPWLTAPGMPTPLCGDVEGLSQRAQPSALSVGVALRERLRLRERHRDELERRQNGSARDPSPWAGAVRRVGDCVGRGERPCAKVNFRELSSL